MELGYLSFIKPDINMFDGSILLETQKELAEFTLNPMIFVYNQANYSQSRTLVLSHPVGLLVTVRVIDRLPFALFFYLGSYK